GRRLVVLATGRVRRQLEPVDAERLDTERAPDEPHCAAGSARLDVVDVYDRVAHRGGAYSARLRIGDLDGSGDDYGSRIGRRPLRVSDDSAGTSDRRGDDVADPDRGLRNRLHGRPPLAGPRRGPRLPLPARRLL